MLRLVTVGAICICVGVWLGIQIGRFYYNTKFRNPEFQEMIALRVARLRHDRFYHEVMEERLRTDIAEEISSREVQHGNYEN